MPEDTLHQVQVSNGTLATNCKTAKKTRVRLLCAATALSLASCSWQKRAIPVGKLSKKVFYLPDCQLKLQIEIAKKGRKGPAILKNGTMWRNTGTQIADI